MKLIRLVVFLAVALVGISIAISNRQPVTLALEPLPYAIDVPLYLVIFAVLFIGVLVGAFAMWWRDGRVRKRARRAEGQANALQKELASEESRALQPVKAG